MQISCPQCATSYELDARLLPPGGAPVQCTRCSHVFIAQPPAAAPALTQPSPDAADELETREEPPPPGERTQIYGKANAGAPAASPAGPAQKIPTGTQVYGNGGSSGARTTQMFGVPATAAPAQPRSSSSTQIFGAVGATASPPDGGAAPDAAPAAPRSSSSTQIFGAVSAPRPGESAAPAAEAPRRTSSATQIFGAVPAAGASSAPSAPTDAAPPSEAPKRTSSATQIFGAVHAPEAQPAAPTPAPQAPQPIPRTTQMFGMAVPPQAKAAPSAEPARASSSTQIFGAVPGVGGAAMPSITPAPATPQDDSNAATVLFGGGIPGAQDVAPSQSDPDGPTSLSADVPESAFEPTYISKRPEADTEPEFEANTSAPAPVSSAPAGAADSASAPVGGRRVTGAPASAPRVLEPFEPPAPLNATGPADDLAEDPAAAFVAAQKRRRNVVLGVIGLGLLGVAGFAAYRFVSNRPVATPAEAIAAHSAAMNVMRRDDPESLAASVVQLDGVVKQWPQFSEARASHLIALLFQLDDVRLNLDRIKQQSDRLNTQIARLKDRKSPSDWENRVNALIDQLETLKKESDPLVERATALDGEVNAAFRALQEKLQSVPTPEDELQLVRAQAVYFGVKGNDQAVVLSERYRVLGGAEGWGDVAYAEYALNTRVAPDTRKQARSALDALKANDASFIRTYVLSGRLAVADKGFDSAISSFEAALALNPRHETARLLLEQARQLKAAAEEPAPAPEATP